MRVLQTAVAIIGWRDGEVGLHCGMPSLRQVLYAELALEQFISRSKRSMTCRL